MTQHYLDDEPVDLEDVPEDRMQDVEVEVDGRRVRPYRFVDVDSPTFFVVS